MDNKIQDIIKDLEQYTIPEVKLQTHTLGNTLQKGILKQIIISNFLLFYLCMFATMRLIGNGN